MAGAMIRYWSPKGEPLELLEWCEMFERRPHDPDESWWRVGHDTVGDALVSTVWVGMNLEPLRYGNAPPLIFESLVMGGPLDGEIRRYATWTQAQAGHADLVELVRLDLRLSVQRQSDTEE